jgi:arylsulfatase A-like enzyme
MRPIARHTARGLNFGLVATALALAVFPHFYSHAWELALFPALAGAVGALVGAVAAAFARRGSSTDPAGRRAAATLIALAVVVLALYALRAPARSWRVSPRLVVMCIDGGTWSVVDPLLDAGRMPTLARLAQEGTRAVLMSTDPSFSMVVWTTIGTGVNPDKHGIVSFYHTREYLKSKRLWEIYEDAGHSIGLFRWWVTWPPRVKNGFEIPDVLARDAASVPAHYEFVNQLRMDVKSGRRIPPGQLVVSGWKFLRAGLRLETCLESAREVLPALGSDRYGDFHIAARRAEIRLNADVYCHLLREFEPEYTCFYDNGVDQLSHFYWEYYQPEKFDDVDPDGVARYGTAIPDYYALNDAVIGRILAHIDTSATTVVLSDHGFAAATGTADWYFPRGVDILSSMGMDSEYFSLALASATFVESIHGDAAEKSAALELARDEFNALTVEETGVPIFNAWIERGRVQLGVSDSLKALEGNVRTPSGLVPLEEWFTTRVFGGTHDPAGIFVARGPAFRRAHEGEVAQLVDVAPTLLYATGFPLSREFDGGVAWDWIPTAFRDARPEEWVDSYGHYDPERRDVEVDAETLKRLRALGYIR